MGSEMTRGLGLENILLLDRMNDFSGQDVLYSFALDEWLCRRTGQGGPAICHIWRHPRGFVMGLRDSRLPGAKQAQQWLESGGWSTAVRNSGGAAVPLDLGVINISLILPKPSALSMHFHNDFERMYSLIQRALAGTGCQVDKGEIKGAYCPGEYDLSINGLKFCGIAQRRQTHAFIVQAFIVAEGSGEERAQHVRSFYERAAVGDAARDYPIVEPSCTASLEELTGLGQGAGKKFADAVKGIIMSQQTAEGMALASAAMSMPTSGQLQQMIHVLRERYAVSS